MNPSEEKREEKNAPAQLHRHVFVVGMWRSGTSLFYALLNQHPQIRLLYEDELPLLWPLFLGKKAKQDWPERWEFWNQALSRHKIALDHLPRNAGGLRQACEAAWNLYAPDATIQGCKSPNYFDCLPRLAQEFPDAKFIVMWRDPADVCRSVVRARTDSFFAKRGMILRALLGCRDLKSGYDTLVANGAAIHAVQYEDLVAKPDEIMQGVCRFLEIDFDRRMVSLKNADRSAIYDGDHHEGVNSERIVRGKKKPEVLPEDVRHKVAAYTTFWKQESNGEWPRHTETATAHLGLPFFFERLVDRIVYRGLRSFDQFVAALYCHLPIGILRKYRASKGRANAEAALTITRTAAEKTQTVQQPSPTTRILVAPNEKEELVGAPEKH